MMKPDESERKPEEEGVIQVLMFHLADRLTLVVSFGQDRSAEPIHNVSNTKKPKRERVGQPETDPVQIVMMSSEESRRRDGQDERCGSAFFNGGRDVRVGSFDVVRHQADVYKPAHTADSEREQIQDAQTDVVQVEMMKT